MRMKKFLVIVSSVILALIVILTIGYIALRLLIGCGGDMVCHATEDHPPGCDEKGTTFFLKKNKEMFFRELPIPDNAFYYLQKEKNYDYNPSAYTGVTPIKIANYDNINLEDFVGKAVCIEGKYRYGLPTFLIDTKDLPAGMISEYEPIVVDVEEIQVVEYN